MSNRLLVFSDTFVISCGTVTLDLREKKVLLIRWRNKNQFLLPKGRKDIGETLEAAALRETFEETGHTVNLLPLTIPTLATVPKSDGHTRSLLTHCTEPFAVQQRITRKGRLKFIYWFTASCDSTLPPVANTQMANEDYETVWATFDAYDKLMTYDDDKSMVSTVIELATGQMKMEAREEGPTGRR
jgi:8-oxo-dGTP pyrophosphatase MutT (NUDIX family)